MSDEQIDAFEDQIPRLQPEFECEMHSSKEREIRTEITKIVRRACQQGMMISSYGTVSRRLKGNDFLITPTNKSRWDIFPEDIVLIKDGKREKGKLPSRATWLHQELYRKNPEINSIILTQSPYLMAYGVTGKKFDVRTIPESWIFLQDVPNMPFGSHFKDRNEILDIIDKDTPVVIVENDSVVVTGDKLLQTFDRLEVAEFSAKSLVLGHSIGDLIPIGAEEIEDLRKKFLS